MFSRLTAAVAALAVAAAASIVFAADARLPHFAAPPVQTASAQSVVTPMVSMGGHPSL
jgi:hypothetical protein